MASIGDLIMRVVADLKGFSTTVEKQATKTGEKAGKNLTKGMAKTSKLSAAKGGVLAGLGLGAGIGLFNVAAKGIGMLTDAFGAAKDAAIADQQSQVKLGASLRANIPDWNGNTDAIEKTLAARMKLGFSDDEQRESLALLTAATHDQTKALEMQRLAMDLARFQGISLAAAGELLVKVQAGQFRALKSLGIQVAKGTTAQQAMAEIQAVVAGQAEDYSNTIGGKLLANQIRFDEAMENFGYKTLPLVSGALETLTHAMDRSTIPLETLTKLAGQGHASARAQFDQLAEAAKQMGVTIEEAYEIASEAGVTSTADIVFAARKTVDALDRSERSINQSTGSMAGGFDDLEDSAKGAAKSTTKAWHEVVYDLVTEGERLIDDFFGPIHAEEDRHDARLAFLAAQESARTAKTKKEKQEAKRAAIAALEDEGSALETLGQQHVLSSSEVDRYAKDVKAYYKSIGKKVPAELQKIIDQLYLLATLTSKPFKVVVKPRFDPRTGGANRNIDRNATGGPVWKDRPTLVGRRDDEMFVPPTNGYIVPDIRALGSGGRANPTYNDSTTINVGRLDKRTMADVRRELKMHSDVKRLRRAS